MAKNTYSNPRLEAVIENWPSGSHRVKAVFRIDQNPKRGERCFRTTERPNQRGRINKPKVTTYARRTRIVDGDDGCIYIAHDHGSHINIFKGTMDYDHELFFVDSPDYAAVLALFN